MSIVYHPPVSIGATAFVSVPIRLAGVPVTGLTFSNYGTIYGTQPGTTVSLTLTGSSFTETDPVNLPGFYEIKLDGVITAVEGPTLVYLPAIVGTSDEVVISLDTVPALASVDLSSVTSSLDDIKGAGFLTGTDSLAVTRATNDLNFASLLDTTLRALGMSQENMTLTGYVYDTNGNLTQSVMTIYPSRNDLILAQNAIATYTMLASYDTSDRLVDYSVRKNP